MTWDAAGNKKHLCQRRFESSQEIGVRKMSSKVNRNMSLEFTFNILCEYR